MKTVTFSELENWKEDGKAFQLIDVREQEEHQSYNIGGLLIPLGELFRRMNELQPELPIVIYCRKGIRSQIAIQRLLSRFPDTSFYNLENGIIHLESDDSGAHNLS